MAISTSYGSRFILIYVINIYGHILISASVVTKELEDAVESSVLKGINRSSWLIPKSHPESYGLSDTGIPKFLIWLGLISEWSKLAPK